MSTQKIHARVDTHGNVTIVDVTGAGRGCLEATRGLEKALGLVDEKSRQTTASMYSVTEQVLQEHIDIY